MTDQPPLDLDLVLLVASHREYGGPETRGRDVVDIWGALGSGIRL